MIFRNAAQVGRRLSGSAAKALLGLAILLVVFGSVSSSAQARGRLPASAHASHAVAHVHLPQRRARVARPYLHRAASRRAHFARSFRLASRRFARRWPALSHARIEAAYSRAPAAGGSVIAEAQRYVGAGNVTGMAGPWCADYVSLVLRHTGHRPLANRMASSALAYAPRVSQPRPGDLVVLGSRRGYASHVGFFAGWDHGRVVMVSGNWGHRVARASVYRGAVAAFIRV